MATEFTLKLLLDKSTNRVLFAEATKVVVDFLFGFLEMPLSSVVKVLAAERMVGSIGNLFQSVSFFEPSYLQSSQVKKNLLDPVIRSSASYDRLLLPAAATVTKYYRCSNYSSSLCALYIANVPGMICPNCKIKMTAEARLVEVSASNTVQSMVGAETNGYVREAMTYTIMDDLVVTPTSIIFATRVLKNYYGVKDVGVLEEKSVKLGFKESLQLLRASLRSRTVLTDVFLSPKSSETVVESETERFVFRLFKELGRQDMLPVASRP